MQAVRAIGRCAVILENAAQRCIAVLLELIQTKVNYVVQEAVIVIKVRHAGHSYSCEGALTAVKDCTGFLPTDLISLHATVVQRQADAIGVCCVCVYAPVSPHLLAGHLPSLSQPV